VKHYFRGFQVLKLSKEDAKKVWECGIDVIFRTEEEVNFAEII